MSSTTFVNGVTLTDQDWFNDMNDVIYDILGNGVSAPTTKASARNNLTLSALTQDTTPDPDADFIETYDTSAGSSKKVLLRTAAKPIQTTLAVTTSGTTADITGIPSWVKRITVGIVGVSTNGTSALLLQIGDSGGIEVVGYTGAAIGFNAAGTSGGMVGGNSGLVIYNVMTAAQNYYGSITLTLVDVGNNTWVSAGNVIDGSLAILCTSTGAKSLSGVLDRIRLTTVTPNTFDLGYFNIVYD